MKNTAQFVIALIFAAFIVSNSAQARATGYPSNQAPTTRLVTTDDATLRAIAGTPRLVQTRTYRNGDVDRAVILRDQEIARASARRSSSRKPRNVTSTYTSRNLRTNNTIGRDLNMPRTNLPRREARELETITDLNRIVRLYGRTNRASTTRRNTDRMNINTNNYI